MRLTNILRKKILWATLLIATLANNSFAADCVNCGPNTAPGQPLNGNKTASMLSLVTDKALSQEEQAFNQYIGVYCVTFEQLPNAYELKKKIIDSMKKSSFGPDRYFMGTGCDPQFIGGTTMPIVHITAENTTDRLVLIKALHKYYTEERTEKPSLWPKVINAKNSRGWTVLDYLQYLVANGKLAKEEEEGVNKFFKYVCESGGKFEFYKDKKCPMEPVKI